MLRRLRGAGVVMKVVIEFFCVFCKLMVLRVDGVDDCISNKQMTPKYSLSQDVKCCREVIQAHDIDPIFFTHRDITPSDVNICAICSN